MENFEIGDVVQLRSGGPNMTVRCEILDGDIVCQWFETDVIHEENFPNAALKKVEQVAAGGSRRDDGVFVMN